MREILKTIKKIILDLLFPCFCFGCGKEGGFLCVDCQLKPNFLNKNSRPLCAFDYADNLIKQLIYAFKYEQLKSLDAVLAGLVCRFLQTKKISFNSGWVISFVPMHPKKQHIRGYNQSELLARELGRLLNLPVLPAIRKIRSTRPQMQLNKKERLVNLTGSFATAQDLANKKIILIDDVCTTGATFMECRKVLLAAGARRVLCLALAKDI